jgi:hypothetical protein
VQRLVLALALALGCTHTTSTPAPSEPIAAAPLAVPIYPDAVEAGLSGGPEPVETFVVHQPVAQVRLFYTRQRLAGFDLDQGELSREKPLCATDRLAKQRHCISVTDENGATTIRIATSSL